ncbi:MAG: hypothetical protein KDJ98_04365 [Rhodobacteraceae bacterium]|nr:hypothetical protein [Paracoccaceae bacterium]
MLFNDRIAIRAIRALPESEAEVRQREEPRSHMMSSKTDTRSGVFGALAALVLGFALPASAQVPNIVQVAAGNQHTCALDDTGRVWCWGDNSMGQLGNGTSTDGLTPVLVRRVTDAVAIASGSDHSCAVLSTGRVACWGNNDYGQLGDGTTGFANPDRVLVRRVGDAVAVAASASHTCALRESGRVYCWGDNAYGQLGDGTADTRLTRVSVRRISDATAIIAGFYHTCALRGSSRIACWGSNRQGQLGIGSSQLQSSPSRLAVRRLRDATAIGSGAYHNCAVRSSGGMACWGYGGDGQIGDGYRGNRWTPATVTGITDARLVSAGFRHSCAIREGGDLACWGDNDFGQLGNGTNTPSATWVAVAGVTDASALSAGRYHTCAALRATGRVVCWGQNWRGQLGDNSNEHRSTPVEVVFPQP